MSFVLKSVVILCNVLSCKDRCEIIFMSILTKFTIRSTLISQRTLCTWPIMVGKGGYFRKGSGNVEICGYGYHRTK